MYLQITERCNMRCRHCGFGCTDKGRDMNKATLNKAVEKFGDHSCIITIGGGEPTIHPRFWEYLGICIANFEGVWLATNGSQTTTALALAKMAKSGVIGVALSVDEYHDEIERIVEEAFDRQKKSIYALNNDDDLREIRTADTIAKIGRASNMPEADEKACICEELFVDPDGYVFHCGCRSLCYGNLHDPNFKIPEIAWNFEGECAKGGEGEDELLSLLNVQERGSETFRTQNNEREENGALQNL